MGLGMNYGLGKLARSTPFTYRQLAWAADCHLREETLSKALAALMNTGNMGVWDVETTREKLTDLPDRQFDPEGLFLVVHGPQQRIVGSACAWLADPAERQQGILHMVYVLPEHRGRRLGYVVCLAVLHRFRQRRIASVRLNTGAQRLGAPSHPVTPARATPG